jgi:hypothetical protein
MAGPKMWRRTTSAAAMFIALFVPSANSQTCNIQSQTLANRLKPPTLVPISSGWYFSQALAYLDAACFSEARLSLDKADESIGTAKTGSRDERERRKFAQDGLRQYIAALELFMRGERVDAKRTLFHLVEENKTRDVYFRSTLTLGSWLSDENNSEEWARIEPFLKELSGRGFAFWQTDFLIRNHQVRIGQGQRALEELIAQLATELPIQRKLALQILLAETLFKVGQTTQAQVLAASIESEVGTKLLDRTLRLRYLALSATIWTGLGQAGGGPYAQKRAQFYSSAQAQAQTEIQQ